MWKIRIKQGKGGQWRWHLYEDGAHAGMMTIRGVATYDEAVAKTKRAFGDMVELVLSSAAIPTWTGRSSPARAIGRTSMAERQGQYDRTGVCPLGDVVYVPQSIVAIPWYQRLLVKLRLRKPLSWKADCTVAAKNASEPLDYTWKRIKE